jgi:hypothetical protein
MLLQTLVYNQYNQKTTWCNKPEYLYYRREIFPGSELISALVTVVLYMIAVERPISYIKQNQLHSLMVIV